jgi:hypothetical protein
MERRKAMPNGIGSPSGGGLGGGPSTPGGVPPIGDGPPPIDKAKNEDQEETNRFERGKHDTEVTGQKESETEPVNNEKSEDNEDKEP